MDPLEDEVLVEMIASGVCHTDELVVGGQLPTGSFPVILGHEGSGRVLKTGSKVTNVKPGDQVLMSYANCQNCGPCRREATYACEQFTPMNFFRVRSNGQAGVGVIKDGPLAGKIVEGTFFGQSSFAQHALAKATSCVGVSGDTDIKLLAPLGCGLQTGAGGVFNAAKLEKRHSVLINGLGGVGMAALFAALSVGPRAIVAVDLNGERLVLAKELGATHIIDPKTLDGTLRDQVKKLLGEGNGGVDIVIETTGHSVAAKNAFLALGPGGRHIQIGASSMELSVGFNDILLSLRSIEPCIEGNDSAERNIKRLIDLHHQGKFPVEKIVSFYPWKDLQRAVDDMHHGKVIKPVIVFEE